MQYLVLTGILLVTLQTVTGQALAIYDVDTADYPLLHAKMYCLDREMKPVVIPVDSLSVQEFAIVRTPRSFLWSPAPDMRPASIVLAYDASRMMEVHSINRVRGDTMRRIGRRAGMHLANILPAGSDAAVLTYSWKSTLLSGLTEDKSQITDALWMLKTDSDGKLATAMTTPGTGAFSVLSATPKRKVVILISTVGNRIDRDAQFTTVINRAITEGVQICGIVLGTSASPELLELVQRTGGVCIDEVTSEEMARTAAVRILGALFAGPPGTITWQSDDHCRYVERPCTARWDTSESRFRFWPPERSHSRLEFDSAVMHVREFRVGSEGVHPLTITAGPSQITVSDVTSCNPLFHMTPGTFSLQPYQSITVNVHYKPLDSAYTWTRFELFTEKCPIVYYADAGWYGVRGNTSLEIIKPVAGDSVLPGAEIPIEWTVTNSWLPCRVEFSTDGGATWSILASDVVGNKYLWNVPNSFSASHSCSLRVVREDATWSLCGKDTVQVLTTGDEICKEEWNHHRYTSVSWSPDWTRLISGRHESSIRTATLWNAETGDTIASKLHFWSWVWSAKWHHASDQILLGGNMFSYDDNCEVMTISGRDLSTIHKVPLPPPSIPVRAIAVAYDPNVTKVAITGDARRDPVDKGWVTIYDLASARYEMSFLAHPGSEIWGIEWSPDGTIIATLSTRGITRVWDAKRGALLWEYGQDYGRNAQIRSIAFSPNGDHLATVIESNKIHVLDTQTGLLVAELNNPVYPAIIRHLNWSPDGSMIAATTSRFTDSQDFNVAVVYDVNKRTVLRVLKGHREEVLGVEWSPEGNRIATGSYDRSIRIWHLGSTVLKQQGLADIIELSVRQSPQLAIELHADTICAGNQGTATIDGGYVAHWEGVGLTPPNHLGNKYHFTAQVPGTYRVIATMSVDSGVVSDTAFVFIRTNDGGHSVKIQRNTATVGGQLRLPISAEGDQGEHVVVRCILPAHQFRFVGLEGGTLVDHQIIDENVELTVDVEAQRDPGSVITGDVYLTSDTALIVSAFALSDNPCAMGNGDVAILSLVGCALPYRMITFLDLSVKIQQIGPSEIVVTTAAGACRSCTVVIYDYLGNELRRYSITDPVTTIDMSPYRGVMLIDVVDQYSVRARRRIIVR